MAHIIGLVQINSRSGCSTIATNLAAGLAQRYRTALIDCSAPQGASASWYARRRSEGRLANLTLATASGCAELLREANRLNRSQDFIVVDAPASRVAMTKTILMASQLVLIPLAASATEIWARDLLQVIKEARERKPELDARIVWTPFHLRTESGEEQWSAVSRELNLKELRYKITYRLSYSDALMQGLSVLEVTDSHAWREMALLTTEIVWALRSRLKWEDP